MTPTPSLPPMAPAWELALQANFGGVAQWRDDFAAKAGTGGVRLCFLPGEGRLANQSVSDAEAVTLLAFERDTPTDIGAFIANIDWEPVYAGYQHAVHEASEAFALAQAAVQGQLLLDVRRAGVYAASPRCIAGASWRDPAQVAQWAAELPAGREVIVYCVYGHEVGRATALRLRAAGVNAHFLSGGIDAWQAAGLPLDPG